MFGIFKKRDPDKEALHAECKQACEACASAPRLVRVAVGYAVNIANSAFIQRFGSAQSFQGAAYRDQSEYIKSLTATVEKLMQSDPHSAVGFRLFTMWVVSLMENDKWLHEKTSAVMAALSREGDIRL